MNIQDNLTTREGVPISLTARDRVIQRYVEIEGQIRKVMMVIKMRGSKHSKDLRLYDVTETGLEVGDSPHEYRGIITGVAQRSEAGTST